MKKTIAILLAALMCMSLLVACGSSDSATTASSAAPASSSAEAQSSSAENTTEAKPEEVYTAYFVYYVANDNWTHLDQVREHISKLTKDALNIDCQLLPFTFATMGTQLPLMLSAHDQIDVFSQSQPRTYYDAGYIVDLMPYKEYIQETLDLLGEEDVMTGLIDGKLLGIPSQLERTHRYGIAMRTDILNEAGYTADDLEECNWDQVTEIYTKVHALHPEMVCFGGARSLAPATNYQDTDPMSDGYGVLDNYGQTFEVTNYYEGDNYKSALSYARDWYTKGFIKKDISVSTDFYEPEVKAGNTFSGACAMKPDSKAEKDDQCAHDMTIFYLKKDMLLGYSGTGWTVSGTAKDKVQAARLLNFVFTSREFEDTINWGVEGLDWVEIEDNIAAYPEGVTPENQGYHNAYGWAYPNERIAHVWVGNQADIFDIYRMAELESYKTWAYGFIFDNTDYQDIISALDNIKDQYYYQLGCGSVEIEPMLSEFNKKMYDSGLQTIMDGKQKQLDDWRAEHGK